MRYGLGPYSLKDHRPADRRSGLYAEILEQARLADHIGFDSIWFSEHHFEPDGCCPAPMTALAAIAVNTRSLRLGTATVSLTLSHPVRIAEDATILDIVSDGRLILGVGAGFAEEEFRAYKVDRSQRDSIFTEAMEVIVTAWTKTNFNYEGRHFKVPTQPFRVFAITPKPVQAPHPPVWVGAFSRASIERAAQWGFPFLAAPTETRRALERKYGWYREALSANGRKPLAVEVPIIREVFLAESEAEARRIATEPILEQYRRYARAGIVRDERGQPMGASDVAWERLADRFIVGTPESVRARIQEYEDTTGLTYLLCRMALPGIPHAAVLRSMRLFMNEVAPYFAGPAPWTAS